MASKQGPERRYVNSYLTHETTDSPLEACRRAIEGLEREMESLVSQRAWLREEMTRLVDEDSKKRRSLQPTTAPIQPIAVARQHSESSLPGGVHTCSSRSDAGVTSQAGSGLGGVGSVKERRLTWSHEVDTADSRGQSKDSRKYHFMFVVEAMGSNFDKIDGFHSFSVGQKFDVLEETVSTGDGGEMLFRARDEKGVIGKVEQRFFLKCHESKPLLARKPWYHGKVPDSTVREKLAKEKPGCFLVKDSDKVVGSLDIIFKDVDAVTCVRVHANENGYCALNRKFKSLDGVVDFYQKIPINGTVTLTEPLVWK